MTRDKTNALTPRHWMLGAALAGTIAATLWAAQTEDEAEAPIQPVAGQRRAPAAAVAAAAPVAPAASAAGNVAPDWTPVERGPWAEAPPSQFAAWSPPPPPPVVAAPPAPPPPPMAPPFPYQLIGRLVEGEGRSEQAQALLAGPTRSVAVKAGEVVDGQWRVDQIGANQVSLTWLPAQLKQTISFRPMP
jgi:hypothetical protein